MQSMQVITAPVAPPQRSSTQREKALELANQIRCYRANEVKPYLRDGTLGVFDAMDDPRCGTMRVRDVLMAVPRLGSSKVDRMLREADIAPSKTCAGITQAQRMRLARVIQERDLRRRIVLRAELAETSEPSGTMVA